MAALSGPNRWKVQVSVQVPIQVSMQVSVQVPIQVCIQVSVQVSCEPTQLTRALNTVRKEEFSMLGSLKGSQQERPVADFTPNYSGNASAICNKWAAA